MAKITIQLNEGPALINDEEWPIYLSLDKERSFTTNKITIRKHAIKGMLIYLEITIHHVKKTIYKGVFIQGYPNSWDIAKYLHKLANSITYDLSNIYNIANHHHQLDNDVKYIINQLPPVEL